MAFEIDGEIIIKKYEADREDFVDLDYLVDVKLKLVFEALLGYKFYIMRASHCLSLDQHDQEKSLVKIPCKHILFTSDGLKFLVWWVTLNSKPFPKVAVGNFKLKSYRKG